MNLQTQNWQNFCTNHLRDWHGIWTRYSPQGEIIESFKSLRSFRSNPAQTEITQTNSYVYVDGKTEEKTWQFNQQFNNLPDGLFHPQRDSMRGFFFTVGAASWAEIKIKTGSHLGVELFFIYENLRHSVGIVYDKSGNLMRTASVREDEEGFPSKYWSMELNLLSERKLSENWQGTSITMTPDLKVSNLVETKLFYHIEGNKNFFFPDEISLSVPEQIKIGTYFTITANWLVTTSYLQQLTIKYNEFGAFSTLTFGEFYS